MSCIECKAYIGDKVSGTCTLNPPTLLRDRNSNNPDSFHQPKVYAEDGCMKEVIKVEEVKATKRPARKR